MLRNIILALVGFVVVALVVLWVLNGGPWRAYNAVKSYSISSSGTTTEAGFVLPWQPADIFPFVEDEQLFENTGAQAELANLNNEYGQTAGDETITLGNPSPLFRSVRFSSRSNPKATSAAEEHVLLEASFSNTAPVSLAGWSLQSALSGVRVPIAHAAAPFHLGAVNALTPISLNPGASALVTSGASPVGVSFEENRCSGYLAQFQTFEPPLSLQCPSPHEDLPLTEDNLQRYGEACFDFARSLPTCTFPQQLPAHLSAECRAYVQIVFSYNGCVNRHQRDPSFSGESWRVYLGAHSELWRNLHDAIRLLDAEGRTVDVYVY